MEGEGMMRIKARSKHNNIPLNFIGIPFVYSDEFNVLRRGHCNDIMVYL
jgi:hypothetical protein